MSLSQNCQLAVASALEAQYRINDGLVDLVRISPDLIALGFTQGEVNQALDEMVRTKRIQYLRGCRIRMLLYRQ